MFALWRDEAMMESVISGDGPHITFLNPESTEGRPWGQSLKKPEGAPLNLG